jgi:hypothetical protein
MKRLKFNRKRNRDQIRYRLHTTIQAAAYLADDPSDQDVDRELSKIMNGAKPKTRVSHKWERCPASEDVTLTVARAVLMLFSILAPVSGLFLFIALHSTGSALVGLAGFATYACFLTGRLIRMSTRMEPVIRTIRMTIKHDLQIRRGPRHGEADPVTGSQQEQTSL